MILTSTLLERIGVRHGFSTRIGGVSTGPLATLDCGPTQDDICRENVRRFAMMIGLSEEQRIVRVNQIHGARVVGAADEGDAGRGHGGGFLHAVGGAGRGSAIMGATTGCQRAGPGA